MRHSLTSLLSKCSSGAPRRESISSIIPVLPEDRSARVERRHIPTTPFRILDAPGVLNDYYLNNLDWKEDRITISLKETVYSYNIDTREVKEIFTNPDGYICSVNEYDCRIHIGDSNGILRVFDLEKECMVLETPQHMTRICSIAVKGDTITSGEKDGLIKNTDTRSGKVEFVFEGHNQEVCGLKWSPSGEYLASGSNDNTCKIWKANSPMARTLTGHNSAVKAMDWCPWKSNILCTGGGSKDKTLRVWDVISGKEVKRVETDSQVCTLTYLSKYKEMVTSHGFQQNDLKLWKATGGIKMLKSFGSHESRVLHTAVSPDETTVVSLGADEALKFWKIGEVAKSKPRRNSLNIR